MGLSAVLEEEIMFQVIVMGLPQPRHDPVRPTWRSRTHIEQPQLHDTRYFLLPESVGIPSNLHTSGPCALNQKARPPLFHSRLGIG